MAAGVAMALWGINGVHAAVVDVSGIPQVPVDTNGDGVPDVGAGDEYYTTTYDTTGNCFYVQGQVNGLVPNTDHAFTFTADESGAFMETSGCGPVQNPRLPGRRLNGTLSSNSGESAACNSLPGGNGDSSGMLVDTTGDGNYDSICARQTSGGLVAVTDINNFMYTPTGGTTPTHFRIPARLRISFGSTSFYNVYIPLENNGTRASASIDGVEVGSLDLANGVTIGNNSFNVFTMRGQGVTQAVPTITPLGLASLMFGVLLVSMFGMRRMYSS